MWKKKGEKIKLIIALAEELNSKYYTQNINILEK